MRWTVVTAFEGPMKEWSLSRTDDGTLEGFNAVDNGHYI